MTQIKFNIVCYLGIFSEGNSLPCRPQLAGYMAARTLHHQIDGKNDPFEDIIAPPVRIITRQSSDVTAINNPEIVKAFHFIKQTAPKKNAENRIKLPKVMEKNILYGRHAMLVRILF